MVKFIRNHKKNYDKEDDEYKGPWDTFLEKSVKFWKSKFKNEVFDPDASIWQSPHTSETLAAKYPEQYFDIYRTLDNGGIGFIVFIEKEESGEHHREPVHVYSRTKSVVINYDDVGDYILLFDNLVGVYHPLDIFIVKSPKNKITDFSGGYGHIGNSILLKLQCDVQNRFRYLRIATELFEFLTEEPITKYVSSVGNSSVPYPYAESANWCYSMSDCVKTPVSDHPDRESKGCIDYVDNALYEDFECKYIYGIDSDLLRTPATNKEEEDSCLVIFPAGTQVYIPKNTSA